MRNSIPLQMVGDRHNITGTTILTRYRTELNFQIITLPGRGLLVQPQTTRNNCSFPCLHRQDGSFVMQWRNTGACLLLAATLCLVDIAFAWDSVQCGPGGPCDDIERAYADIIQGEGCRTIFSAGMCSGLCTRSLKAMIGRHLWTKCANRCDWSPGVVAAANSWLALCVSRPAPDVNEPEIIEITSHRGQRIDSAVDGDASGAHVDVSNHREQQQQQTREDKFDDVHPTSLMGMCLAVFAILAIAVVTVVMRYISTGRPPPRAFGRKGAKSGDGLLGSRTYIPRGASRHLKGMRGAYID
jgi:hypothetical protein